MATETLRIDVTVNNKTAIAGLKQTEAELGKVAAASLRTGQTVARGSNQAANALTNLGRVAQDAPFGFIGIQNNLNPLLESFQRLKVESGSTGGALKALAGSLIGPAGLGLALSVGSGLLIAFGDEIMALFGSTSKLSKENEALAKSIDGFRESAAKEIVSFKQLAAVAADSTIPLVQRKQAVDQLQKTYPAYLSNLSQEDILSGKLGGAYDQIVTALKAKIALQAAEEKVIPLIKEQLRVQEQLANAQKAVAAVAGLTAKDFQEAEKFARSAGKINPLKGLQVEAKKASDQIPELEKAYKSFENQIKTMFQTMQPLITASNGLNQEFIDNVKEGTDDLSNYIKELMRVRTLQQQGMRNVAPKPVLAADYGTPQVVPSDAMVQRTQAMIAAMQAQFDYAAAVKVTTMNEEAAAAMANVATSAFTSLGTAMLQGQDFGDALANTFKKLLIDLTQMVVKALLFKAILTSLSGGTGIAGFGGGGGGLNFFKGLMGFSDGGIASGPKSGYPVMLHGTEAILNPRQFKTLTSNMMNIGASQGAGQMQAAASGQVVLRGQDLVLALQRAGVNLDLRRG